MPDLTALSGMVICAECCRPMVRIPTRHSARYWACQNCGRTAATHPDGRLMSTAADEKLRGLRREVHAAMDAAFSSKTAAYDWLETHTPEGHVGFLDPAGCRRVLRLLRLRTGVI